MKKWSYLDLATTCALVGFQVRNYHAALTTINVHEQSV